MDRVAPHSHRCPFWGCSTPCPSLPTVRGGRAWELEGHNLRPPCPTWVWVPHAVLPGQRAYLTELHPFLEVQGNLDRHLFFLPELGSE